MVHGLLFCVTDSYGWLGGARHSIMRVIITVWTRGVRGHDRNVRTLFTVYAMPRKKPFERAQYPRYVMGLQGT